MLWFSLAFHTGKSRPLSNGYNAGMESVILNESSDGEPMKHDFSIVLWAFERLSLEVFLRKVLQKDQRLLALALSDATEGTKKRVQGSTSRNAFATLTEEIALVSKKATEDKVLQAKKDLLVMAEQLSSENNSGVRWPKIAANETSLSDEVSGKDESGYLRRVLEGAVLALNGVHLRSLVHEWMKDPMFLAAVLSLPREARQILYKEVSAKYKDEIGNTLAEGYLVVMRPTEALMARKALVFRLNECRKKGVIQVAADISLVKQGSGLNWSHYQRMLNFQDELGRLDTEQTIEFFLSFPLYQGVLAIYEIEASLRKQIYQNIGVLGAGALCYQRDEIDANELLEEADNIRTKMLEYMQNLRKVTIDFAD